MPAGRSVWLEHGLPAGGGLVGVRGAYDVEPGDRPQRGEVLDRLVGRPVLAEADRVVRPHVGDRQPHQRGQPHRGAHVVGEGEEGGAEDAGAAVDGDAVQDRAHAVLADAEVEHPAGVRVGLPHLGGAGLRDERRSVLDGGVVGLGEVGRAAPQLGHLRCDRVDHRAGRLAGGHPLVVGGPARQVAVPALGQGAGLHPLEEGDVGGRLAGPGGVLLVPRGLLRLAALDGLAGVLDDLVGDLEGLVGVEAEDLLGRGDLVVTEGRAVGLAGVLGVGGRPGDDRLAAR